MRRSCFILAVFLIDASILGPSLFGICCFADPAPAKPEKMIPAEFVQPPKIFVRHTAKTEYSAASVVRATSGKLVISAWKFESNDGGRTWLPIEKDGWLGCRNVIRLRDGRWMAIVGRPSRHGQSGSVLSFQSSLDDAKTWSDPVDFREDDAIYYVMNERVIETSKKALIVPVARGSGKYEGDNNSAGCFFSTDGGKNWSLSETWARLDGERGMQEPNIAELSDGMLYMLARTGKGSHHSSYSSDGGRTWSPPKPTTLKAACSPLTMKTMPDGRLFVIYDHAQASSPDSFFPRRPLVWAVSSDGGTSWSPPHVIDATEKQQHIYASITFLDHGILIVYSSVYSNGSFKFPTDYWKVGGGKSCILRYPKKQ